MDRGTRWATVVRTAKSWTWRKRPSTSMRHWAKFWATRCILIHYNISSFIDENLKFKEDKQLAPNHTTRAEYCKGTGAEQAGWGFQKPCLNWTVWKKRDKKLSVQVTIYVYSSYNTFRKQWITSDDWKIEKTFQWNIFLKFKKFVFWESRHMCTHTHTHTHTHTTGFIP